MDPDPQMSTYIILSLVFILSCGFFSAVETAIISLNDNKLKELAAQGHRNAIKITKMVEEPTRFLSTVQIGVVFSQLAMCAFVANIFSIELTQKIQPLLSFIRVSQSCLHVVVTILVSVALTFFTLLLGYNIPKKIASCYADHLAYVLAPLLLLFYRLLYPIVGLLNLITKLILKLFRINYNAVDDDVTEEEIRMLVDVGNEKGIIEQSEKDMIDNIFEFDDKAAGDIMTHRTDLISLEKSESAYVAAKLSLEHGYSRLPVYDDEIDNIIGVLNIKDLLVLVGETSEEVMSMPVSKFIRPVMFIPESNRCSDLFTTFKMQRIQIAVVVDEYGGTAGIVTMEDLLESIVGNMQDEYDNEEEEIIELSENVFSLDGSLSIDDVEKLLDIEIENGEDYDTLGGFITDITGGIPKDSDRPVTVIEHVKFTVLEVKDRRITRVKAEKLSPLIEND